MLDSSSTVAVCLQDRKMIDAVTTVLVAHKLNKVVQFQSVDEAFEILSRQQVDLIIVGLEMKDHPGVTLMQRLRETGNYGLEPFFFVGKNVDKQTLSIFLEYDVDYVLTPPVNIKTIEAKVGFVLECENSVSKELQIYRDAKSAFMNGVYEMAESFAMQILDCEKLRVKGMVLLSDIAVKQEDYARAERLILEAEERDPYSVAILHKKAHIYRCGNRLDDAKECLDQLAVENPMHLKVLERAGLTNLELGHFELAEKQMKNLEMIDKNSKVATESLATVAIEKGDFSGVGEKLLANHTEKEVVTLLNSAGIKLSKKQDFEGAIAIYTDCLDIVKKKEYIGKIHYNIALGYKGLSQFKLCVRHCLKSLDAYPELEKALNLKVEAEMLLK